MITSSWKNIVAIILLFIFGKTAYSYPIVVTIRTLSHPLLEGVRFSQTKFQNEWATFTQLRAQKEQLENLKEENIQLIAQNSYLKILREEQRSWYVQNQIKPSPDFALLPAVILTAQDQLILTLKADAQIPPQSVVVYNQNLLGIVHSQSDRTIIAYPLTHPSTQLPVLIVSSDGVKGRGVLQPSFGTALQVVNVLQNIKIDIGDSINLLPSSLYPDSIHIGKVAKIIRHESEVFQTLEIVPDIDLDTTYNVSIYIKKSL